MDVPMPATEFRVRAFLAETFAAPEDLDPGQSLLEGGLIDSFGVLTLVTWIEETWEVVVDDDEVIPENLDGIARLVDFIEHKTADAGHRH